MAEGHSLKLVPGFCFRGLNKVRGSQEQGRSETKPSQSPTEARKQDIQDPRMRPKDGGKLLFKGKSK